MVEPGDDLVLGRGVVVPAGELVWRFSGSGGPGGQHANTANTRVEVVWDVAASPSIPPAVRERIVARLGDEVAVAASDHRSQYQNRRVALQRLDAQLRAAMVVPRRRVPTRRTLGSQQRRLDDKRQQAERKASRRRPGPPDD